MATKATARPYRASTARKDEYADCGLTDRELTGLMEVFAIHLASATREMDRRRLAAEQLRSSKPAAPPKSAPKRRNPAASS